MFIMSRQITRRQVRLNKLMESRIPGDGYVRFGGRFRETYYRDIEQGARSRAYFLTTSHDGSGSIVAAFTPIRIVCNNTLNVALKNKTNCIKIKHTNNAKDRLQEAHKLMGISSSLAQELEGVFNQWSRIRVTDQEVLKLVQQAMAPSKEVLKNVLDNRDDENSTHFKNICNNVLEYALGSSTQQTATTKGTLFGAYNAVTGYYQNVKSHKNEEQKLKSIQFGTGLQRSQQAFRLCQSFARNKSDLPLFV